ncbi:AAA family ATPase, partial [Candidatus Pacearchaeota archaeon]|nr:AAA family ATPase [Candidatus Pacearchaeota archaeon]
GSSVSEKEKEIEKIKKVISEIRTNIIDFEAKINSINSAMQKSAGFEQEKLNQEIANLRADIAGISVKVENYADKIGEIEKQKSDLEIKIRDGEISIRELKKTSPAIENKQKDVEAKKKELEKLEEQRKKFYMMKSELKSLKERLEDKKSLLQNYNNESDFIIRQIDQISGELFDGKTDGKKIGELKSAIAEKKAEFDSLSEKESKMQKILFVDESEIEKSQKLREKISKMDVCPVCKSKITQNHVHSIESETSEEMGKLKKEIENCRREMEEIAKRKESLKREMAEKNTEVLKRESDLMKLSGIEEKKERIKNLQEKSGLLKGEISEIGKNLLRIEKISDENSNIEEKYETAKIEVQEISLRSRENLTSEVSFKEREFERFKISLKQLLREKEDFNAELSLNKNVLKEKEKILGQKKKQEEELSKKFRELILERDELQKKIRESETGVFEKQKILYGMEQEINNFNIEKARMKAEIENLETDILEFQNVEIIRANRDSLVNRLGQTKEMLSKIGSVNLLSLEVYDNVKKEYDSVKEKADIVEKEKESIMKTINEIDKKKKKTFMKTLDELNGIFSRNFSDLSQKGVVSLELEDKKEPFNGGVEIIVKTGHGKYFDVGSLSGGEQTLVALSLIFAIQELKPYHFYILDEVDAALDKRNSERLSELLKKHMKKGQYLIITHNDDVILNASNLYGVSMHEGISKIISLKI